MSDIDDLYSQLHDFVNKIQVEFVDGFIADPNAKHDDYEYYVKAYCVLCHAAIEEYLEEVARTILLNCTDACLRNRVYSVSLVALIGHHHKPIKDADEKHLRNSFDFMRQLIDAAKSEFSNVIHNNHGTDISYLKKLMQPVAIDITNDPGLLNSLSQLAKQRGEFAHTGLGRKRIKQKLAPEDARDIVLDCLKLCDEIRESANSRLILITP